MTVFYFACQGQAEKNFDEFFSNFDPSGSSSLGCCAAEKKQVNLAELQGLLKDLESWQLRTRVPVEDSRVLNIMEDALGLEWQLKTMRDDEIKNKPRLADGDVLVLADFSGSDPRFFTEGQYDCWASIIWKIISFRQGISAKPANLGQPDGPGYYIPGEQRNIGR